MHMLIVIYNRSDTYPARNIIQRVLSSSQAFLQRSAFLQLEIIELVIR